MQESNNIIPPTTTSLGLAEALLGVSVTRLPNGNYEVGPEFGSCIIEAREIVRIYTADANDVFRRIEQWMTASRVCNCANQHEAVPCESCALHDLLMSASILLAEQRRGIDEINRRSQWDWIWRESLKERDQQDLQHGGEAHDNTHTPADWCDFITHQIKRMAQESGRVPTEAPRFIKIIALAVAAIQREVRVAKGRRAFLNTVVCRECGDSYQLEYEQDHQSLCPDCREWPEPSGADRQADEMP